MSDRDGDASAAGYLASKRVEILRSLEDIGRSRGDELEAVFPGGAGLMSRIVEYASRGKMLRGSLVHLGAALFGAPGAPGAAETAAAIELFQAGLLIHDDIMDRDDRRRGSPSVHASFVEEGRKAGAGDPRHFGESLATCAGDVCFFEALRALSAVATVLGPAASSLLALCGGELSVVGLAQMADCRFGDLPDEPSEEAIVAMYRGKTARYSFSLPLALGAALAGRDDVRAAIFAVGDLAGLAFQLRDDEIGIFGDPDDTGKISGSDIRENKKTVWRSRLLSRAGGQDKARLLSIYGNPSIGGPEIDLVRSLTSSLGVMAEITGWRNDLLIRAKALVSGLEACEERSRRTLVDLIDWLVSRTY